VPRNLPEVVGVRDRKDEAAPAFTFTPEQWAAFVDGVKGGEFDLPE
jgi:hypothetical protein